MMHGPRSGYPGSLQIDIAWKLRNDWRAKSLLRRVAEHVSRAVGFSTGQLSVAVVGARRMTTLHQAYMNIAAPTDVLTFDLDTCVDDGHLEGEIVVCGDVARRNATTPTIAAARNELALYVTHGILHLAGYDDHTAADFDRMHSREDELLTELGLGPVFASRRL